MKHDNTMWILLLSLTLEFNHATIFPETHKYEVFGKSLTIGECVMLEAITNFPQNGSEIIRWEKDSKLLQENQRIKINGKSLSITAATRDEAAYYKVIVVNNYKNVIEVTDIWLNVKGCGKNEKENAQGSTQSCTKLCEDKCSADWIYVPTTTSKCVQYFSKTKSWSQASEHCQSLGGELTTINSKDENKLMADMLETAAGGWIGLNDRINEGIYIWNFKESNLPSFFTWGLDEPSNFNSICNIENCVTLRKSDGKWTDVVCQSFATYVCEVQQEYNGTDKSQWKCFGSRCYKYFHELLVWDDALKRCQRIHPSGKLAAINSESENGIVRELVNANEAWIGLNDIWEAGRYTWNSYKDRGELYSYKNWGGGEPNDKFYEPFAPKCPGEDCVQVRQFGGNVTWHDLNCESKLPYICEVVRTRQFSTGAYVGIIIGSLLLFCIIGGVIKFSFEKHKRTAVKDIIKAAYDADDTKKTNTVAFK